MSHLNFLRSQQSNYNVRQPNMFIANDAVDKATNDRNDTKLFGVFGSLSQKDSTTETRQVNSSPFTKFFNYIVSGASLYPPELDQANDLCMSYSNMDDDPDISNRLKSLKGYKDNQYNREATQRCGWIYNRQKNIFTGHLGLKTNEQDGQPVTVIDRQPTNYVKYTPGSNIGTNTLWFWDLDDPNLEMFKEFHKCNMSRCSDIGDSNNRYYSNCGWDNKTIMGVPINPDGITRKYHTSNDPFYTRSQDGTIGEIGTLYTKRNYTETGCTASSAPGGGGGNVVTPAQCFLDSPACSASNLNGISIRSSRQCLREIYNCTTCSNNGALYLALQGSAGEDYTYGLNNSNSYVRYVNDFFLTNPDNNIQNIFGSNASHNTFDNVFNDFNTLNTNAQLYAANKSSKNAAAHDLCFASGTYDNYDFCAEYVDETVNRSYNPFKLECMQREFRHQGGQISGKSYPLANNLPNEYTWRQYKNDVAALKVRTNSTNLQEQAEAFMQFYGIPMQQFSKQFINRVQGVEVFWFTNDTPPRFLGRRVQTDLSLKINNFVNTNVSFVSFFNLRPASLAMSNAQITINTTNNVSVSLNSWITETDGFQKSKLNLPGSGNVKTSDCLNIEYNKPNYYTVKWTNTTSPSFTMQFNQCSNVAGSVTKSSTPMPSDYFTLSQEPDAPMMSFDVQPAPTADQIKFFSADTVLSYFFGDARLLYMIGMILVGSGLTLIPTINFGFSNRTLDSYIYGALKLTNSQLMQTSAIIGTQSWRTITMLFNIYVLPTDTNPKQYIFQYGTLSISAVKFGNICQIEINDGTIRKLTNPLTINTSYYLVIIQDQPESNPYGKVTNIRICCAPLANIQADPAIIFSTNSAFTYYKPDDGTTSPASYWGTVDGNKLTIGGYNDTVVQSLNMNVGWLRVFDYVFTTDDIADDANNRWQRNWFNMI